MKKVQIKSKSTMNVLTYRCYNGTSTAVLFPCHFSDFLDHTFHPILTYSKSYELVISQKKTRVVHKDVF